MNIVTLSGYLAQDPAMVGSDNTAGCRLRVAINNYRRQSDGSWKEETNFFDVYIFGKQATNIMNRARKGDYASVVGHLGVGKNNKLYIRADKVDIVSRAPKKEASGAKKTSGEEEVEIPF